MLLTTLGCKKKCGSGSNSGSRSPKSPQSSSGSSGSGLVTQGDSAAARETYDNPVLAQLTRNLRRWIAANKQVPKSFEDFAAKAGLNVPPPPVGMMYALSKEMRVILVDQK